MCSHKERILELLRTRNWYTTLESEYLLGYDAV
jgi:hypothetical protein